MAKEWIRSGHKNKERECFFRFAIVRQEDDMLIGGITLWNNTSDDGALVGYWLGKDYWGNEYMVEAVQAVIEIAFRTLKISCIWAACLQSNHQSGRVLEKAGFKHEYSYRRNIPARNKIETWERYRIINA